MVHGHWDSTPLGLELNLISHVAMNPSILSIPIICLIDTSSKQQNGELSPTEGAESASLQEEGSRTDGCVEKDESSKDEHPNVTVIIDGPDDGAASDSTPQPVANHTQRDLSENSTKPSDPHANQVGSNTDQDVSNVSGDH